MIAVHAFPYVCILYVRTICVYTYFPVSSSVTNATVTMITPENDTNTTYSITITCTIHPDSDTDVCEVRAIGNNGQVLPGNECEYIILYVHLRTYIYQYAYQNKTTLHVREVTMSQSSK